MVSIIILGQRLISTPPHLYLKAVNSDRSNISTSGRLARIGPNHLLTDDAEINWRILGPHSKYRRGNWFDSLRFNPHYTSIASETDPVKHDALRWKVSAGVCA